MTSIRRWTRTGFAALLITLTAWACEQATSPLLEPGAVAHTDGTETTVKYKALKGVYDGKTRTDEQVIQPSAGGNVGVAGTVLIIPAGAVSEPTLFSMKLAGVDTIDGTTKLTMKLRAFQKDSKGKYTVDVGAQGFLKPLELRMSTDWVSEAYDPAQARVVWFKADGGQEVFTTWISSDGRFASNLWHFSDYGIGVPREDDLL